MVKAESVAFWVLILSVIGILIWLAFGSPEFERSLIAIGIFVASSEIFLWKALFGFDNKNFERFSKLDKKTSVGFERVRSDFKLVNDRLGNIEKSVVEIRDSLLGRSVSRKRGR